MPTCAICSTPVPAPSWTAHVTGKKHLSRVTEMRERVDAAARSVYVKKVTPDMTEDDLRVAFEAQGGGPVDRVVIDPRRTVFAIVCYADRAHCAAALAKEPTLTVRGHVVHYVARSVPEGADALARLDATGDAALPAEDEAALAVTVKQREETAAAAANGSGRDRHRGLWSAAAGVDAAHRRLPVAVLRREGAALLQHAAEQQQTTGPEGSRTALFAAAAQNALQLLQPLFPHTRVHVVPIGSVATGLARDTSDLDLAVDVEGVGADEVADTAVAALRGCAAAAHVMPILTHRLKVVSYKDISNDGLGVDLSFGNPLAVRNTALVAEYLSICPGLGELVMALTDWIAVNVHKLSAYAIFMLAVFYLQQEGEICNLQALAKACPSCLAEEAVHGGAHSQTSPAAKRSKSDGEPVTPEEEYDCRYCTHVVAGRREDDALPEWLGRHFLGCLLFYANDWPALAQVVSIRLGQPLPVANVTGGFWTKSGLLVEDPFETVHNVASNFSTRHWRNLGRAARDHIALLRQHAGLRRVTRSLPMEQVPDADALHARGAEFAAALNCEWYVKPAVALPEALPARRWRFSGAPNNWLHRRRARRHPETVAGQPPLEVDVLWPEEGRRLVLEVTSENLDGVVEGFDTWLALFVRDVAGTNHVGNGNGSEQGDDGVIDGSAMETD